MGSGRSGAGMPRAEVLVVLGLLVGVAGFLGVVAGNAPTLALAGAAVLFGGFALLARPEYTAAAVAFLLWANVPVVAMRDHGVPKALASLYLLALLLPILRSALIERRGLVLSKGMPWLALFAGLSFLSAAFARKPELALGEATDIAIEGVLVFVLISQAIRDRDSLRRVTWGLMLAGGFMGAIALFQQATGHFDSDFGGFSMIDSGFSTGEITTQGRSSQPRLAGPIGEKNRFGQIMLVLVALGIGLARAERSVGMRRIVYGLVGLSAIGSALTFSRGNAVAFALLLGVMVSVGTISKRQVGGLFLAAGFMLLLMPQYRDRLMTIGSVLSLASSTPSASTPDGAILGRATEVIAALLVYADHPVLGVGPGQFASYSQEYGNKLGLRRLDTEREAHTLFPHVAAEGGTLGLIAFSGVLVTILLSLYRRSKQTEDPVLAHLATAYLLAISAYLLCGIFLHMAFIRYYWFLVGVASAAATLPVEPSSHELEARARGERSVEAPEGVVSI
ncbi:O-Antigen ligase [Planctomycetes bacterium Poly30]|uniref:O-Antigen ligase n=2 Tax=Saltatorellus ferox TaxID=2528018 RepID=A0A518EM89_9BACT|nr:O-Antigen ligase [Planctomycetes bacterium Poly30]